MSESREVAANACSVAASPETKREFFQLSKYSFIVGIMTTRAVKASASLGSQALAVVCSSLAYMSNACAEPSSTLASGSASPNSAVPSPSKSASTPFAVNSGLVPKRLVSSM